MYPQTLQSLFPPLYWYPYARTGMSGASQRSVMLVSVLPAMMMFCGGGGVPCAPTTVGISSAVSNKTAVSRLSPTLPSPERDKNPLLRFIICHLFIGLVYSGCP